MATLHVAFSSSVRRADGAAAVLRGAPHSAEALTTSTTSAATTATAPDHYDGAIVAVVTAVAVAHYVTAGADPTASATAGYYVPADQSLVLSVQPGDKIAARTVS